MSHLKHHHFFNKPFSLKNTLFPQNKAKFGLGVSYVLVASALWGSSGVAGQFLLQHKNFTPEWLVTIRLLIAGLLLLIMAHYQKGNNIFKIWHSRRSIIQLIIFAIFGAIAIQLTYFITIKHSNAATAAVLQYIYPVIVAIIISIQYKKAPSLAMITAIILALMGAFLLATHGSFTSLAITPAALIWGIISGFASAFYTLYPHKLIQQFGTIAVVGWSMLIGGLILCIFYPPWRIQGAIIDSDSLLIIAFLVVFGSMFGYFLYLLGVEIVGGTSASVLDCAEPLSAAILSVLLLHTHFVPIEWLGTACVILTVFILAKDKRT